MTDASVKNTGKAFRVLAIDGGGAKGMFAVGALIELERTLGRPCNEVFDLVYGTSVGAIVATMIAIGHDAEEIEKWFLKEIPRIMRPRFPSQRSRVLRSTIRDYFGVRKFDDVDMLLGIVATRTDFYRPMIFKTSPTQAIKGGQSFVPGWGASLADALVASCAAQPVFDSVIVPDTTEGDVPAIDGGFVANNPCMFALIDAIYTLGQPREDVVAVSVGVGEYPKKTPSRIAQLLKKYWSTQLLETVHSANANTMEQLVNVLFGDVSIIRVDKTFADPQYATSLLESSSEKLKFMARAGRQELREKGEEELRTRLQLPIGSSNSR
jgi:predicted acylesterase/phospholipase RssA